MPDFSALRLQRARPPYPREALVNIDGCLFWVTETGALVPLAGKEVPDRGHKRTMNRRRHV